MIQSDIKPIDLQSLFDLLPNLTPNDRSLIERAYLKAEAAHAGVLRKSGEPYFTHPVAVAQILAEMKLDSEAIAAALLHDVVEDTSITEEEIEREFGKTVADIVRGVTKIAMMSIKEPDKKGRNADRELEYIRKMTMAMGDDIRVMLVKLADRLHNMRTLGFMKPEKQAKIAQETLDIFAPLANRLGMWQFKWELEDLSFRYLQPEAYKKIAESIDERRVDREKYMGDVSNQLRQELEKHGITQVKISGRPKHNYSIYKKMVRKGVPFEEVYDVRAVRVIVNTIPECYMALGYVHNLWHPIPGEFDDYIAAPKDNFYQSLHTAVIDDRGNTLEVQIRTLDMHEHAEYGVAAHWRYKEGGKGAPDQNFEDRIAYLRRLLEVTEDKEDAQSYVDSMRTDVFQNRVYAFTPKGDIIDLPAGATPVDFAYHIHTDIGHRCRGARVNGKLVGLEYVLRSGDRVEILTTNRGGPSLDWLNPNHGFVNTARARSKIQYYFRKQNREKHVSDGRDVLERELKRLGLVDTMAMESVATLFQHEKLEDFLAHVGEGEINGAQIGNKILEAERREQIERERDILKAHPSVPTQDISQGITVRGSSGLMVNVANCCNPVPGDPIVGYVTRGRGVTVHRNDCVNIRAEPERLIEVSWGNAMVEQRYSVPVEVIAYDREGLMRDISTIVSDEKVNMSDVRVDVRQNIATLQLVIDLVDLNHLTRVLTRVGAIPSVVEARRRNLQ